MLDLSKAVIVKKGKCLYNGIAEYEVIIIQSDILYCSGDYEDPPEIADDRDVTCYYGWFDSPQNRGVFNTGRGGFLTVGEAVKDIESFVSVSWM